MTVNGCTGIRRKTPNKVSQRKKSEYRSENRRNVRSEKTVMIDEYGDMGKKNGSSKKFMMVATITDLPGEFVAIEKRYPKNTGIDPGKRKDLPNTLKYRTSDRNVKRKVLRDIAKTGPRIRAVAVDKSAAAKQGKALYMYTVDNCV